MNVIQKSSSTPLHGIGAIETAAKPAVVVNLYHDPPSSVELSLDQFEVHALKRLKVLKKIEQLQMMRVPPDQFKAKLNQVLKEEDLQAVDETSHFILRLSYCQSEELRRWFLQHECALFKHRLQSLPQSQLAQSVQTICQLQPISNTLKTKLQDLLLQLYNPTEFASTAFYAVPFTQVLDLVATRQCLVQAGQAYVPHSKVVSILVAKFRSELSRCLTLMGNMGSFKAAQDPESQRVYPLLKNLNSCMVVNRDHDDGGDQDIGAELTAGNVKSFVNNMPLCMRVMQQDGLERDHKLKHWGRLQYGLFLKGAGLSLEDSLLFFQRHFTLMTGEQFQKEHGYFFRYMYGKEGKRTSFSPYSCPKIILGNAPSADAVYGCPYKHYDEGHLASLLSKLNVGTGKDRAQIVALKKSNQFQLACQKHFDVMHPNAMSYESVPVDGVGNHPNAWFRASVAYRQETSNGQTAAATP